MLQALKNKRQSDIVLQAAVKSKRKIQKFKTRLTAKVENACRQITMSAFDDKKPEII